MDLNLSSIWTHITEYTLHRKSCLTLSSRRWQRRDSDSAASTAYSLLFHIRLIPFLLTECRGCLKCKTRLRQKCPQNILGLGLMLKLTSVWIRVDARPQPVRPGGHGACGLLLHADIWCYHIPHQHVVQTGLQADESAVEEGSDCWWTSINNLTYQTYSVSPAGPQAWTWGHWGNPRWFPGVDFFFFFFFSFRLN